MHSSLQVDFNFFNFFCKVKKVKIYFYSICTSHTSQTYPYTNFLFYCKSYLVSYIKQENSSYRSKIPLRYREFSIFCISSVLLYFTLLICTAIYSLPGRSSRNLPECTPLSSMIIFQVSITLTWNLLSSSK